MIQQKKINVERILRVNRVGAWRIEIEDGKAPRFYADAVMDELLGIQGEISPEERFTFHQARVHPDDMQLFLEYSDKLSETKIRNRISLYSSYIWRDVRTLQWHKR